MAGLAKGLMILEAFAPERSALSVADAARCTGVTRAAARRCLLTLTALGYLVQEGRVFHPLPRLMRLGGAYLGTSPLPEAARPVLIAARDALEESVSLAVLEDGHAAFIARAEARRIVETGVKVGARLPLWCSATGRMLLAGEPEETVRAVLAAARLERRTPRTLVTMDDILGAVATARAHSVAICDEELELGLRAMAVPVRDPAGRTAAVMSVSTSSARVRLSEMRETMLPVLRHHAAMLERSGHRWAPL